MVGPALMVNEAVGRVEQHPRAGGQASVLQLHTIGPQDSLDPYTVSRLSKDC